MNEGAGRVGALLRELEVALRVTSLWDTIAPTPAALASEEPFCVDTLSLPQWLQWIFIPRMRAVLDARAALPAKCAIAAMAEVYFMGEEGGARSRVIGILRDIDAAVENAAKPPGA